MNIDRLRILLNILFIVAAFATIIVYFMVDNDILFIYVCGAAIVIKLLEYTLRFIHR